MAPILTAEKNEIAMQKDIFRFAATLYAETSDAFSSAESQLQMIKCIFVNVDNVPLSSLEIVDKLRDSFKYHVSEEEVQSAIQKSRKTFQEVTIDKETHYKLIDSVYSETVVAQSNNIDSHIDRFIKKNDIQNSEHCKEAIHEYLYELTTTNINTYRILLSGKSGLSFCDKELSVDISYLNKEEQEFVYSFVSWDDAEKNIALTNLVFTCLEYCLLINGDHPNKLISSSIRKREIYLDTNIIFRALGINGKRRKKTVDAFLKKCKQANLRLIISFSTKKEFNDTISYYVNQIRSFPRGNIYHGAYEELSDYTIFSLYDEWRCDHPSMSLMYFEMYIKSLYGAFVKEYDIVDDEKIPRDVYDSDQFKTERNNYSSSIKHTKEETKDYYTDDYSYSSRDSHDACMVRYVEIRREQVRNDSDVFFVSSDKILRYWDMSRSENDYPVVIYPSQLFLVLLKTCGRSEDDFSSFVSFINIVPRRSQISPEKANAIISGISIITDDIQSQKILVSAICEGKYQDVINGDESNDELYQAVQTICQNYLKEELEKKEQKIASLEADTVSKNESIVSLEEKNNDQAKEISTLKDEVSAQKADLEKTQKELESMSESHKEQICAFAKKKTAFAWALKWYILPIITIILVSLFFLFVVLQFVFADAKWNIATIIMNKIGETPFGKNVEGYYAIVDGGILAFLLSFIIPTCWVKPWDKDKRDADKQNRIEKYIKRHHLQ